MPEKVVHFPPAPGRASVSVGQICAAFLDRWQGTDVAEGAQTLSAQLPEHVPGALRLVMARALRQLDVPPFASVEEFRSAVGRFALRPPKLCTVSDVRRARRARRTTLNRMAEQTGLPLYALRQLEWGDFREWRDGAWTEEVVRGYARAAELDEARVLAIVEAERQAQLVPWVATGPAVVVPLSSVTLRGAGADVDARREAAANDDRAETRAASEGRAISQRDAAPFWLAAASVVMLAAGLWIGGTAIDRGLHSTRHQSSIGQPVLPENAVRALEPQAPAVATAGAVPPSRSSPSSNAPTAVPTPKSKTLSTATDDRAATFSPAFSNVGSAVFYHRNEEAGTALMKAEYDTQTGDLRIINIVEDGARNYHVRPSPDGTRIAFDSDRDGERGVYIATMEGQDVQRVSGPGFAAVPSWSPDGNRLAYVRAEADGRTWNLWVLDLRSHETRRLTSYRYGQPWGASWFPDGRRVAFSHEDRLNVLDLVTGSTRSYRTPRAGRLMRTPAVSPDGHHIAFQVSRDGAWLLDLADGSMQRILADPTAEEFAWDADGRRLAFHSRRSGQWSVWIMATPAS